MFYRCIKYVSHIDIYFKNRSNVEAKFYRYQLNVVEYGHIRIVL